MSHGTSSRSKRLLALCCAVVLASACAASGRGTGYVAPAGESDHANVPTADEPIPSKPGKLALKIDANERRLLVRLRTWIANGAKLDGRLVDELRLRALYQQRITRRLAQWEGLARRTLRRIDKRYLAFYRANIRAHRILLALGGTPPDRPPRYRYARAKAPNTLMRFYRVGKKRFGIPPKILASMNFVETKFGRVLGPSTAGALGPMQFLPSTWEAYGNGGDIWDPRDSIVAAARYLDASGAPQRMRDALYAYNPSDAYVRTILIYANRMRRNPLRYYDYFFWQVFVRTRDGVVQLTGPGSPRPNL